MYFINKNNSNLCIIELQKDFPLKKDPSTIQKLYKKFVDEFKLPIISINTTRIQMIMK